MAPVHAELTCLFPPRRLGLPDSRIILMLSDTYACDPRNGRPGEIFSGAGSGGNLFTPDTQIDYSGRDANVENVLRVLTGAQAG